MHRIDFRGGQLFESQIFHGEPRLHADFLQPNRSLQDIAHLRLVPGLQSGDPGAILPFRWRKVHNKSDPSR